MSLYKYTPSVAIRLSNPLEKPDTIASGKQYAYFDYIVWNSSSRILTFNVNYTANDLTLNGLGLRFHYDASKATYEKEDSYGSVVNVSNHKSIFKVNKSLSSSSNYSIDGADDPSLSLVRGKTYTFEMIGSGHPFYIKSKETSSGTSDQYITGVSRSGSSTSVNNGDKLIFQVPLNAPDKLWYQCSAHSGMLGELNIVDINIDSSTDINGKGLDKITPLGLKVSGQNSQADTGNQDGSSATNQFVQVDWEYIDSSNSNEPSWPSVENENLFEMNLKVADSVTQMEVGISADNSVSTGNALDSKKVMIDVTSKDSKVNFTGALVKDWKKSASDNSRGEELKQTSIIFSEVNHKTTFIVDKSLSTTNDYSIDGANDPSLTLVRGNSYSFEMKGSGHPFFIKSKSDSSGTSDEYKIGVTRIGNSTSSNDGDKLIFKVPYNAPDKLWYQCSSHSNMLGELKVVDSSISTDNLGVVDLTELKEADYIVGYKSDESLSAKQKINNAIDVLDILEIAKYMGGIKQFTNVEKVAANIDATSSGSETSIDVLDILAIAKIMGGLSKHEDLTHQFVVRDNSLSDPFANPNVSIKTGFSYNLDSILLGDVDGSWSP